MTKKEEKIVKDFEEKILGEIYHEYEFIPNLDIRGIIPAQGEEAGLLQKTLLLSDLRKLLELTKKEDDIILTILESLGKKGLFNLHRIEITNEMNVDDLRFKFYLGTALRERGRWDWFKPLKKSMIALKYEEIRRHDSKPLTDEEMKKFPPLLNVRETVEGIRGRRDESFRSMGNTDDSLRLADRKATEKYIEAELNYKRAVLDVAKFIEGGEEGKEEKEAVES